MLRRNYRKLSFLITTALVFACAMPELVPASPPILPTFDPNSVNISIAQTANAAATKTALMSPPTLTSTATFLPTVTIAETPTPFLFILATATVPSSTPTLGSTGAKYDCRIESQSPVDNIGLTKGADFDMTWRVINIGTDLWNSSNADYRYISGDKIHKASIYDLEKSVPVGGQTDIIVDMKAPSDAGTYTTAWNITVGKSRFCTMRLTIIVN